MEDLDIGAAQDALSILATGAASSPHEGARVRAFATLGHRIEMVSPMPAEIPGVAVHVAAGRSAFAPLRRVSTMLATLRLVHRHRAEVTHCHYAAEYATWAAALLGSRPLVVTVMGGDVLFEEQGRHSWLSRALTRFALRRADLVTVKSPRLGEVVAGFGVPRDRIVTVLWGIDLDGFRPNPAARAELRGLWGADDGRHVCFSPRPLKPFYNQMLMLEALAKALARGRDAMLVVSAFAPEPGFREALEARAEALGCAGRLHFAAPRPHAGMADLYAACDSVLSLPPSDGFPQTLVEAAALGKPCVMTAPERYEGLLEPGRHALFSALAPDAVADAIASLANDPPRGVALARESLAFARAHADLPREAVRVAERMRALARPAPLASFHAR